MSYKVVPIPANILSEVRRTLVSPQYTSLAAAVSVADGYGPCRSCLKVFDQGRDKRIFFTYNSFEGRADLPDPGPVFIHESECERYNADGLPTDLKSLPVLFEAYGREGRMMSRTKMEAETSGEQIDAILCDPQVRFVNLRNAEAGCFIATIERN